MIKKIYIFFFLFLILTSAKSGERSEKEIKLGVFLSDLELIGSFKEINYSPEGMFPESATSFHKKQDISQKKFLKTFVTQKGLMEKYSDRVILGMAYFEYFYMQQLKESEKSLNTFKNKYPNVIAIVKNDIKKLHGLSKARKSMREAVGISLDEAPETAIKRYYVLYKLLNQAKIDTKKLTRDEKSLIKKNKIILGYVSKLESLVEDKLEMRLTDQKYQKEYQKHIKKLSKILKKSEDIKDYELLSSFIIEIDALKDTDLYSLLSGLKISKFILQNIQKDKLPKKFGQDLSDANFDDFNQNELEILANITNSMKTNKSIQSNDIQLQILNLENTGIPVSKFLDVYRKELDVKLDSLNLQVASASAMQNWKLSDWANAWKTQIPKTIVNNDGIEIALSNDEIESIKAQLAMKNFKEILNLDNFSNLIQDNAGEFQNIANDLNTNFQSFEFSFALDDFAKSFGDIYGLDIGNYSDLTDLANAQHGANWSVEEYAAAYQDNVDIINALQSGSLSSFDAGQIAAAAGSSLQEVADTIAIASSVGVSVDLDATVQGMGYGSFAEAVDAYNAEHGTDYTVETAKEALGQ